jgi:3-methylcrotonyl-CoA carboxylase alpha subunit
MFHKILIANRGEIACRVMTTAARLGVRTVAVYSDADIGAKHVAMADEAYRLGPSPAAESYLRIERIIEACRASGAEAVHPGYGFLSENPDLVEAVEAAGLVFIGPPASAIRAMGLKDAAKRLMVQAGVPVVPGYHGDEQDPALLAAEAETMGYPVLIKARAGGGGKGMRRVDDPGEFAPALEGAQREGQASFGDSRVLVEKYLTIPRHIEIQVFGDNHGNALHLFERDCSLQRRHQKVIEEAPAPGMPEAMRRAMGEAAVTAAKAIGYSGAGTVEFIADVSDGLRPDRFYFMEMNTRLQVEHPVTEFITGQDLVEWQLRVAVGEPLPLSQEALAINGWAFEARIYAEDPGKGFLPATGTLVHLALPDHRARVDSGVRQGDEITPFYDPMIAKLIVHGPTRSAALNKLSAALDDCQVAGAVTNIDFLARLCRNEAFARGEVDTGLIDRHLESLTAQIEPPREALALAALASLGIARPHSDASPWDALAGWRLWSEAKQFAQLERNGETIELRVVAKGRDHFEVEDSQGALGIAVLERNDRRLRVNVGGRVAAATVVEHGQSITVFLEGGAYEFRMPDRLAEDEQAEAGGDQVIAPMPGLVKVVSTQAGASVSKGQSLVVMEAMKMELTLRAPRDGAVGELFVSQGEQVPEGTVLLVLVPEEV